MYIVTIDVGEAHVPLKYSDKEDAVNFMESVIDKMEGGSLKLERVEDEKSPE